MTEPSGKWQIDRTIGVGVILALIVQTAAIAGWASNIATRVEALEEKSKVTLPYTERITRLETKLESISATLEKIDAKLQRRSPGD